MGLGHGHQDLAKVYDPTLVLERSDSSVTAGAKLFMYNNIRGDNLESFNSVFVIVGLAVILIFGLVMALSLRLRKDELYTMFTIG